MDELCLAISVQSFRVMNNASYEQSMNQYMFMHLYSIFGALFKDSTFSRDVDKENKGSFTFSLLKLKKYSLSKIQKQNKIKQKKQRNKWR